MTTHREKVRSLYYFKKQKDVLLRHGSKRKAVKDLQHLLHDLGFGGGRTRQEFVSGSYDDDTARAIKGFADRNDVSVSADAGRTLSLRRREAEPLVALHRLLEPLQGLARDLADWDAVQADYAHRQGGGHRGARIETLQLLLGVKAGGWAGYYTKKTIAAIQSFAGGGADGLRFTRPMADKLYAELRPRFGEHCADLPERPEQKDEDEVKVEPKKQPPPDPPVPSAKPVRPDPPDQPETPEKPSVDLRVDKPGVTARLLNLMPVGQELEFWCWAASTQMMLSYLRSQEESECPTCGRKGHHDGDISQGRQMNRRLWDSSVDCSLERGDDFDYKTCDRGGWPYFFEYEGSIESTKWAARRHAVEEHGLVLLDGGQRVRLRRRLTDRQLAALTYGSGREFRKRLDDTEGAALGWEMLTGLLDHQRPVVFTYRWPNRGSGHMRLAAGYAVTPGDKRWVVVADPLPPGMGEFHLIPYEYYVDGPSDGHWRDYWVRPAESAPERLRRPSHELQVGRELVASYITYDKERPPRQDATFSPEDRAAVLAEARTGLLAVEAIGCEAPELAMNLMIGNPLTPALVGFFGGQQEPAVAPPEVKPGELVLSEDGLLPVYELSVKDLREWKPPSSADKPDPAKILDGILGLLRRPREVICQIDHPDREPFPLFATVTVRRKGDRWRVSSLGKAYLMASLMTQEFVVGFLGGLFSNSAHSYERMFKFFAYAGAHGSESGEPPSTAELEKATKAGKEADEKQRKERKKKRAEEIKELRTTLKSSLSVYPPKLWDRRYDLGPKDSLKTGQEEAAALFSTALQSLQAPEVRKELKKLKPALGNKQPEVEARLVELLGLPAVAPGEAEGLWTLRDYLVEFMDGEEEILRRWEKWRAVASPDGDGGDKELEELFEASRDQEIAWLTLRYRSLSNSYGSLADLTNAKKLDATLDGPTGSPKARYIVSVPELYQMLIGYSHAESGRPDPDDRVESAYGDKSFHRPERRVESGTLLEVLKDLQHIANKRKVMRGG